MTDNSPPGSPLSLPELKRRGDTHMADAHQAVEEARRLARETVEVRAESERLHDRFHGPRSEVTLLR